VYALRFGGHFPQSLGSSLPPDAGSAKWMRSSALRDIANGAAVDRAHTENRFGFGEFQL